MLWFDSICLTPFVPNLWLLLFRILVLVFCAPIICDGSFLLGIYYLLFDVTLIWLSEWVSALPSLELSIKMSVSHSSGNLDNVFKMNFRSITHKNTIRSIGFSVKHGSDVIFLWFLLTSFVLVNEGMYLPITRFYLVPVVVQLVPRTICGLVITNTCCGTAT